MLAGVTVSRSGAWGAGSPSAACPGGPDHVPGGAASIFPLSSTQVNAPCRVTQKCRRCNRNVPPLVGPATSPGSGCPPGHRETPSPARGPGAGAGGGEAMCPRAQRAAVSEEGKTPREGSCPPPPKESGPGDSSGAGMRAPMPLGAGEGRGDGAAPSTLQGGHGRVFSHRRLPRAPGEAGVSAGFLRLALGIPCLLPSVLPPSLPGTARIPPRASSASLPGQSLLPSPGAARIPA